MTRGQHGIGAIALGAVVALAAAGCDGAGGAPAATRVTSAGPARAGGTLYYLTNQPADHLDPQRTSITRDVANEVRLVYRTLTSFPVASGAAATRLVGDLATDTGTASHGAKSWSFTLKDAVRWQDGSDITCADLKYGMSRAFATTVITGGPSYPLQFLDIPTDPRGGSLYKGPYVRDPAGQALFDRAVSCEAKTITFRLSKPVSDFNYVVSKPAFAPYKADLDKGEKSNFTVFSCGPYQLQGTWMPGQGGTFIRNPSWNPRTDTIRRAFPDKIEVIEGLTDVAIAQRLISDEGNDRFDVTDRSIPLALRPNVKVNPAMSTRSEDVDSHVVEYLVPNFTTMTNPLVRQALALATNKSGWVAANGGTSAGKAAQSITSAWAPGSTAAEVLNAADSGSPGRSRDLLTQAGVKVPYPITFTYMGDSSATAKSVAALKAGWDAGGFATTVNNLTSSSYNPVQNRANAKKYDLTFATWGGAWPSASSVIPPLFDSRPNLSVSSNGVDYGWYQSHAVNSSIDASYATLDPSVQAQMWGNIDRKLARDVAYIPLRTQKLFLAWGSGIAGWIDNPAVSDYPDLASVGVNVHPN